jgi:energy-coupling factor transport system ATP-binding protein
MYQINHFQVRYSQQSSVIQFNGKVSIQQGDCVLLHGNSGCGKSTLLLALKGLIPNFIYATIAGELNYQNKPITQLTLQQSAEIAYLAQNPHQQIICPDVFSELAFGLENLALDKQTIEVKIHQILAEFKLTNLLNRSTATLSGGEKQIINLVAILLQQPKVLLLDEPTAFLDPQSAQQVMTILANYRSKMTIVIVEHNLAYIKSLVDRVIHLTDQHQLIEMDPTQLNWQLKLPCLIPQSPLKYTNHLLKISGLTFGFCSDSAPLLQQINLSIAQSEIIGLTGVNGCGKSTLLKLIAGIIPSSEQIFWQHQAINRLKPQQLWHKISLVWQNPETHFLANSVSSELNNNLNLMRQFNLEHVANSSPYNISEGQKRRLALAIVLQQPSQLILMDEPTFGQDYQNKLDLAQQIKNLAEHGYAFILVSQDHQFIQALTKRCYQLDQGCLSLC